MTTDGNTVGPRVLLVLPVTQFRDEEVFGPKERLEKAGARVTLAASAVRTCYGMKGGSVVAEVAIGEADPSHYGALVIAGGSSVPALFWKDKSLAALVTAIAEAGKPVGAFSLSTVVLAHAKLLEGKQATVYHLPEAIEELEGAGATYVPGPLVVEGRLLMASGPDAVGAFSDALIGLLGDPVAA
jgi:protease I